MTVKLTLQCANLVFLPSDGLLAFEEATLYFRQLGDCLGNLLKGFGIDRQPH
jgi:hypothetical protein